MTNETYEIPSWAAAILFWRKVLDVESKGVPGTRGPAGRPAVAPGARDRG
jgi:hypothetical protein